MEHILILPNFSVSWKMTRKDLRHGGQRKKINKYVYSTIQNEVMQIMTLRVLREVAGNIQDVDFYSVRCHDAADVKNVSELIVCLRWVDEELEAHEEFIDLKNMQSTDADSIVRELKDVLLRRHLKLNKCRGQCYDGCSTMSGSKRGVTVQIKSEEEPALYTHCYAYSINLAVGDTLKVCLILKDTIDNTYEMANW